MYKYTLLHARIENNFSLTLVALVKLQKSEGSFKI